MLFHFLEENNNRVLRNMENESTDYIDFYQLKDLLEVKDSELMKLYFREIYKDLITKADTNNPAKVSKIIFMEYINLPLIISEKLFNSFDHDKDGYLSLKEFVKNLTDLFTGSFEEVMSIIFSLLDFDLDGFIIPQDVKLLLSYLPLNIKNEYKFQMASLSEIDGIILQLFNGRRNLNLTEFIYATENHHSDAFLQILCFLYERKPFTNQSIKIIAKKQSPKGDNLNLLKLMEYHKKHLSSPSKKNLPSPNRRSLLSPVKLLDEVKNSRSPKRVVHRGSVVIPTISLDSSLLSNKPPLTDTSISSKNNNCFYEDFLYKLTKTKNMKKYYIVLTGKDMYFFKDESKEEILGMHHLSGCYVKSVKDASINMEAYYSFTIQYKKKKRIYFTKNKRTAINWQKNLMSAIGNLIFQNYYEVIENIGEGKFGIVKLCENKTTGMKVAVKILTRSEMREAEVELLYSELEIMKLVRHPNIVSLIDLFENSEHIFIVMDYYKGGDLTNYLNKHKYKLTEEQVAKLIYQIASGIKYLHEYGIVHRDLKPDNIMLSDLSDEPSVKIMDFGLSKIMGVNETAADGFGTLSFVAPEVLLRKPYNKEIDIWSIGVITYYALTGTLPFDDEDDNEERIARKTVYQEVDFPERHWSKRSPEVIDLIKKCLVKETEKRVLIDDLLKHKWLLKYKI